MSSRLTPPQLDEILALQASVAWAGEGAGEPRRLGWWKSDLVDREGGGDLLARLVPHTAPWASLALVRQAARRVDESAREKLGQGDRVWTLFRFGFVVDEQLEDRLAQHRAAGAEPAQVLGEQYVIEKPWDRSGFAQRLESLGQPKVEVVPGGRKLRTRTSSPVEAARLLAAALVPLGAEYPLPYLEAAPSSEKGV